jgi:NAD(P)-dependent dehydrogenase (short-subunit alcohol dehydrogenase family)
MYPSLAGKRVLITGGGSGIGAAIVSAFTGQGAHVSFIDIAAGDPAPGFIQCDLTDLDALAAALSALLEGGPIDILVNNAANDDRHNVADVTPAYWDERMAVNLRHLFFCAQAVAPGMAERGGGAILNLGSISWHLAQANLSLYMTAKAAIEGLTRGLARDLGGDGIRVSCIIPGSVLTPRQARWHSPEGEAHILAAQCLHERVLVEDIAAMALFLGSDNAARCTGRDYYVDAGWYGA